MPGDARKLAVDPALESLARAPQGEPLTAEEAARLEQIRTRGPVPAIPHSAVIVELAERSRRGE
jgi:hypothetical protein